MSSCGPFRTDANNLRPTSSAAKPPNPGALAGNVGGVALNKNVDAPLPTSVKNTPGGFAPNAGNVMPVTSCALAVAALRAALVAQANRTKARFISVSPKNKSVGFQQHLLAPAAIARQSVNNFENYPQRPPPSLGLSRDQR
jgi:hypothetical protein